MVTAESGLVVVVGCAPVSVVAVSVCELSSNAPAALAEMEGWASVVAAVSWVAVPTTVVSVGWPETSVVVVVSERLDVSPWATCNRVVSGRAAFTAALVEVCDSMAATEEVASTAPGWDAAPASPCATAAVEPACDAKVTTVCSVVNGSAAAAAPTIGAAICMLAAAGKS